MTQKEEFNDFVATIRKEFPNYKIVPKEDSLFMKLLYYGTLMFIWNRRFMEDYITQVSKTCYMPYRYINTTIGVDILRHELVHLRDTKKWGVFLFVLTYALLPLPVIVTGRAYWEFRGYCESLNAEHDRRGRVMESSIDFYVGQFTGSGYLFMFPFRKFMKKKFVEFCNKKGYEIIPLLKK